MDEAATKLNQAGVNSPREIAMKGTLEAGKELLRLRGPAITLSNVPLEEAINLAGVPRASVYRAWQGYGEGGSARDNFHEALACYLLEQGFAGGPDGVIVLNQQLDSLIEAYPSTKLCAMGIADRRALLRSTIASIAVLAIQTTVSKEWQARIAVSAALASQPEDAVSSRLKASYLEGEQEAVARYQPIYERISSHFGMRIKGHYTMRHFATTVLGVAEGIRARELYLADHISPFPEPWGLFNTSLLGLVHEYFEEDPDHPTPTALA